MLDRLKQAWRELSPAFLSQLKKVALAILERELTMLFLAKVIRTSVGFRAWLGRFLVKYCFKFLIKPMIDEGIKLGVYSYHVARGEILINEARNAEIKKDYKKWRDTMDRIFN